MTSVDSGIENYTESDEDMRIDLHTHSLLSDGTDTPAELVEQAAAARLDVVALTDHDIVAGWDEATAAGDRLGIKVVRGTEFSTTNEGRGQHLLGYNFDRYHPAIADILQRGARSRAKRVADLFGRLDSLGLPVDRNFVNSLADGLPSRMHMAVGMVKAGHVAEIDQAFAKWLNEGRPAYVQRDRPTIEEAVAAIRTAGGVSVIAHPRDEKRGPGITEARFAELAEAGLAGIEVDHQKHDDPYVRAELRSIAKNLGLAVTGSSDYHGTNKIDHDLGCNLTDPDVARSLLGPNFDRR